MIKHILIATALAALPATAFAQTTGPLIRDPATGGVMHDPALAGPMFGSPMMTEPAQNTMVTDEPAFRNYVMAQHIRSYRYREPVEVGTVLPARGVVYHNVPAAYGAPGYRYTVVNNEAVIVEPRTRRVVEIIE